MVKILTLGAAIGHALKPHSMEAHALDEHISEDYGRWTLSLVDLSFKTLCLLLAWFMQRIITALHSSIRGGTMFSRNLLAYLDRIGFVHVRADDATLPEALGYMCAALGLYLQLSYGKSTPPFPLIFCSCRLFFPNGS